MRFSPSTGCFYPESLTYDAVPEDLIEVSDEQYAAAMDRGPRDSLTVQDGALMITPYVPSIDDAMAAKIDELSAAYWATIGAPIAFTTAAGTKAIFAQTTQAKKQLDQCLSAASETKIWAPNLWLDANGLPVTPFTFADLQGLQQAIENADMVAAYQKFLMLIGQVHAATSIAAVKAITWA